MSKTTERVNLAYAYSCAVQAHLKFKEDHSCIENATINFELVSGVTWAIEASGRGGYVSFSYEGNDFDPENPEYGYEVNWIEYEDENYLHVDADDGCGNRHIQLVFLKSEEVK